jgi:nucleoside-diphosphate-sugar epimerase
MRPLLESKIVVVTGAGGFIGPSVVQAMLRHGARVRALVGPPGKSVCKPPEGVLTAFCDITDAAVVRELVEGSDAVVHLAGPASVSESFENATEYARVHVCGTATVLDACREEGIRRFVYISSAEVYGRSETELVEEHQRLEARSPYGAAKIGAEKLVEAFVLNAGIQAAILRPFSVYGPGLSRQSVLGTILHQAQSDNFIQLRDLKPIRDYCYLDDLAQAIVLSCVANIDRQCVINIGTGIGTSVGELAQLVLKVRGLNLPIRECKQEERPATAEIVRLVADFRIARKVLGWSSQTPLAVGIQRTAQCFVA